MWFTSDTHFGHANILKYCPDTRRYKDIHEHDEALIRAWNDRVGSSDDVYHLGDFAFMQPHQIENVLHRLNGRIHLIVGNHDRVANFELMPKIVTITPYHEVKVSKKKSFVLFHYPIESWNKSHHGSIHLHGHTHGSVKHHPHQPKAKRMDVGVDCHPENAPFSVDEILRHVGD